MMSLSQKNMIVLAIVAIANGATRAMAAEYVGNGVPDSNVAEMPPHELGPFGGSAKERTFPVAMPYTDAPGPIVQEDTPLAETALQLKTAAYTKAKELKTGAHHTAMLHVPGYKTVSEKYEAGKEMAKAEVQARYEAGKAAMGTHYQTGKAAVKMFTVNKVIPKVAQANEFANRHPTATKTAAYVGYYAFMFAIGRCLTPAILSCFGGSAQAAVMEDALQKAGSVQKEDYVKYMNGAAVKVQERAASALHNVATQAKKHVGPAVGSLRATAAQIVRDSHGSLTDALQHV